MFQKPLKMDTLKKGDAMPKRVLPLTDLQVKTAKPKAKDYKLTDGGGLYLLMPAVMMMVGMVKGLATETTEANAHN